MAVTSELTGEALAALAARFEAEPAEAVVAWAVDTFHPRLAVASSMTDAVLIDLAVRACADIEVVFIDTGYHFQETLETVETVRRRYRIDVRVMRPQPVPPEPWVTDPEACCSATKVAQLEQALAGKDAWMTGMRRADAPSRQGAPVVSRDGRGLVKVNPIATWSDGDVAAYIQAHDVPVNPLVAQGYVSIGCWPCTRPVADGEDRRAGRWPGLAKTECGLHVNTG